jgi:hypothetical protein
VTAEFDALLKSPQRLQMELDAADKLLPKIQLSLTELQAQGDGLELFCSVVHRVHMMPDEVIVELKQDVLMGRFAGLESIPETEADSTIRLTTKALGAG